MNNHTITQREALLLLKARLDPKHPMHTASPEIGAALSGPLHLYFDTWVLPLVDYLLKGEAYYGQAAEIRREFASRQAAADSRARHVNKLGDINSPS